VTRALCIALALTACAPAYSLATRKPAPVALHALDMVAFSAGMIVGLDAYNGNREPVQMYGGFSLALAAWLPYWFVATDGRQ
jgi:hypothetical protein